MDSNGKLFLCKRTQTIIEPQTKKEDMNWLNQRYYRPSNQRGSQCSSWRRRKRPFNALKVVVTKVEG